MKIILFIVCFYMFIGKLSCNVRCDPPGHMQPLGSHKLPEKDIEETKTFPDPEIFYKLYVNPGKPLLFKGLAKTTSAFYLWSDDYFSSKYGDVEIDFEINKKENRTSYLHHSTLREFLAIYNNSDYYVVSDVPEEMFDDVMVPKSVLCGGFQEVHQKTVIWFSSGGTKSVFHFDELDNINCLYAGSKNLVLISRNDYEELIFDQIDEGYSSVDVEKVDMYKYSFLQNISWYNVTMETGDCLFIPYKWAHHVISSNTRNLAVNLWFAHLFNFNSSDCQNISELPEWRSLAFYPKSKNSRLVGERGHLITIGEPYWPLTFDQMVEKFMGHFETLEKAKNVFDHLDVDKDQQLSLDEIWNCELQELAYLFNLLQNDDESQDEISEDFSTQADIKDHNYYSEL